MDLSSFTNDTFFISGYGIPSTPDWDIKYYDSEDINNSIIHLDGFTLTPEKDYIVTLKSTVKDVAGNAYGNDKYWTFRTGLATDQTAPTGSISVASGPVSIIELRCQRDYSKSGYRCY